jgi:hypothetical protein
MNQIRNNIRIPWEKDGAGGENDPSNSMNILLEWMTIDGGKNYERYQGKSNNGMTKKDFGDIIAEKMNKAGVKVPRLGKHIVNKIEYLEKSFKSAHDFAFTSTGAGLMETDEGTFQDAIKKKCLYYDELLPIFTDRASARPQVSNFSLNELSDEDRRARTAEKQQREEEREMRKRIQEDERNERKEGNDDTSSSSRISIPLILSFPSQHNNHPDDSVEDFDDVDVLPTTAFRPIKITPTTTTRPLSVAGSIPRGGSMSESIDLTLQASFADFTQSKRDETRRHHKSLELHHKTMTELAKATWDREDKIANAKFEHDNKERLYDIYDKQKAKGMRNKKIFERFPEMIGIVIPDEEDEGDDKN